MIEKIISGGQTGADQGALDAAIKLNIPHGGWVPKGRLTEDGPLPEKYCLKEMPTSSYPKRTEQNVKEADGTLILSHGKLTGGSSLTRQLAFKHGKPCLHIDFETVIPFNAAREIVSWMEKNNISVLNVAGTRASENPLIHDVTMDVIEAAYYLGLMEESHQYLSEHAQEYIHNFPTTVKEAVKRLTSELTLKDRATIANMTEHEVIHLNTTLGQYIEGNFGILSGNRALIDDCKKESGNEQFEDNLSWEVILKALWRHLKKTHSLRIVK